MCESEYYEYYEYEYYEYEYHYNKIIWLLTSTVPPP